MKEGNRKLSERVVYTVADVLGEDPMDLPPLEKTVSADALDYLFYRKDHPAGAYTVFPYCDLWVVVHSTGTIDVFDTYRATSAGEQLPDDVPEPAANERMAVLHFEQERYTFYEDQLDTLHRIISEADSVDEAWEESVEYARQQAD
jgi:hypothetical protein